MHFAEFYGWYEDKAHYFLAMEYFEHGTLLDYMKDLSNPLPEDDAGEITKQLLQGVAIMHTNKYAHRDLKPSVCPDPPRRK